MQRLQGFQHTAALDLNMGYYHIILDPDAQKWTKCVDKNWYARGQKLIFGTYQSRRLGMFRCTNIS